MDPRDITNINDFQSTVLKVAKSFVGLNLYNFHNLINTSLQILGEKLHADRAYLFSYNFEINTMNNDYEWCNEGVTSEIHNLYGVPITDYLEGWVNEHLEKKNVIINDVSLLDKTSNIYNLLRTHGIVSVISLPIFIDNTCYGYLGFDSKSKKQDWEKYEKLVDILPELYSSLIVNYEMLEEYQYMQLEAEKAANKERDFLSKMTHEIRTPLNGVANALYLLEETNPSQDQKQYLDIMKYSIDVLSSLVNNALDYSKSDANKLTHKTSAIHLESELIKIIDMNKYMASSKGLGLYLNYDYNLPITLSTDIEKLRQVLNNLIQNAIKYTNYGHIEVKVTSTKTYSPYTDIMFEVIDTGIGISDQNKDLIFEEFYQVGDHLNKNAQGTGLGLTIAKTFVEFLKGDLQVESKEREGSNFHFTLTLYSPTLEEREIIDEKCFVIDMSKDPHSNIVNQLQAHFREVQICDITLIEQCNGHDFDTVFVYTNQSSTFSKSFLKIKDKLQKQFSKSKKILLYDMIKSQEFVNVLDSFDHTLEVPIVSEKIVDIVLNNSSEMKTSERKEDEVMSNNNKILLVDDNNINRKVMVALLKGMNLEVEEAKDGYQAIEKVKEQNFKMILMDIFMPGLDGYETAKRIRELKGVKGTVPIIAVTANDVETTKEQVLETGMNGVLSKPLKKKELEQLLSEYSTTVIEKNMESDLPIFNQEDFEKQLEEVLLRKEIIKTFLDENETDIENIKLAFMSANSKQIHKVVHYLKGTFSYLRADRILKLAQTIIDLSRKDQIDEILYLEQALLSNYEQLVERLKAYNNTL